MDKRTKAIGNGDIHNCASLDAVIGRGIGQLFKYSLLGYTHLLVLIMFEEANKNITL
jgi:hypothetical protein